MDEPDPRPLNGEAPIESVRRLLTEAERVSRELGEVADEMVARAEAGRQDAQRVVAALHEAATTLAGAELGGALDGAAPAGKPERAAGFDRGAPAGSDGARLVARQMLAAGADREDVERNLRVGFGIENADAIVDSILTGDS